MTSNGGQTTSSELKTWENLVIVEIMFARHLPLLLGCLLGVEGTCQSSDAALRSAQLLVCSSLLGPYPTSWCDFPSLTSVSAGESWPSQAVYMAMVSDLLTSPTTCLNTSIAQQVVSWLDGPMADPTISGAFMNQWVVFQFGYYSMPRPPGDRIESPWTLGMKCWAMTFLQQSYPTQLQSRLSQAGLSAATYLTNYKNASVEAMKLCWKVLANCFVNASYDPSRNGTCPYLADEFESGFEWENIDQEEDLAFPFSP